MKSMYGWEMIKIIKEMMIETAESFQRAMTIYWPQTEGGTSDPPERNLSFGFARSLLNRDYHLYAEAMHPNRANARIDILAISSNRQHYIVCEFKVYRKGSGMSKSFDDVERVSEFTLARYTNPSRVGSKRIETVNMCKQRYGIVGGILESSDRNPPDMKKSSKHLEFENKVISLGGVICEPIFLLNFTSGSGSYWLAYAVMP